MSFLEDLGHVRDQVLAKSKKEIVVPVGPWVVRFRPPQGDDARDRLTPVVVAYRTGGALTSDQELQLLVDCCDEILKRNEDGELEPYEGGPFRFDAGDERWGDDVHTARDCVAKLYNLDEFPLAVSGTADTLVDWLQGMDAMIEEAVRAEGKSEGADAPS